MMLVSFLEEVEVAGQMEAEEVAQSQEEVVECLSLEVVVVEDYLNTVATMQ